MVLLPNQLQIQWTAADGLLGIRLQFYHTFEAYHIFGGGSTVTVAILDAFVEEERFRKDRNLGVAP